MGQNMMRTSALLRLLIPLLLTSGPVLAADFLTEFSRLKEVGDGGAVREFLLKAADVEKDNPDFYASAGNYWWQLGKEVSITAKPVEGDGIGVHDTESGDQVGSITTLGRANPEIPKRAVDLLATGAERFPERADIALGLAHVRKEMGMDRESVDTLLALLKVVEKEPGKLRWTKNGKLPGDEAVFIPEAVQGYSADLFNKDTPASDELCAQLCDATIRAFPEHPFAYNIKAVVAVAHEKHEEALQWLELAHSKAPDDALILMNLGDIYAKTGKHAEARKSISAILEIEGVEDGLKQEAIEKIRELDEAKPVGGEDPGKP